jgi:hypothetical protein
MLPTFSGACEAMTKYLNEYVPGTRQVDRQVQSDYDKLKFNNILSCMALVLVPDGGHTMTGVHLTVASTMQGKEDELKQVLGELKAAAGAPPLDAYITCCWGNYKASGLVKGLKKFCRAIYLCDIPQYGRSTPGNDSANADVKVHLLGGKAQAYIRQHAENLRNPDGGGFMQRPDYDRRNWKPGKPVNLTDRDTRPWSPIAFTRLL